MGNWNISIRGLGPHHNKDFPNDADRLAARFVRELLSAGHLVVSAEITHGGATDLVLEGTPPPDFSLPKASP